MPGPSSETVISTHCLSWPGRGRMRARIVPEPSIASRALRTRLLSTRSSCTGSASSGGHVASTSTSSRMPSGSSDRRRSRKAARSSSAWMATGLRGDWWASVNRSRVRTAQYSAASSRSVRISWTSSESGSECRSRLVLPRIAVSLLLEVMSDNRPRAAPASRACAHRPGSCASRCTSVTFVQVPEQADRPAVAGGHPRAGRPSARARPGSGTRVCRSVRARRAGAARGRPVRPARREPGASADAVRPSRNGLPTAASGSAKCSSSANGRFIFTMRPDGSLSATPTGDVSSRVVNIDASRRYWSEQLVEERADLCSADEDGGQDPGLDAGSRIGHAQAFDDEQDRRHRDAQQTECEDAIPELLVRLPENGRRSEHRARTQQEVPDRLGRRRAEQGSERSAGRPRCPLARAGSGGAPEDRRTRRAPA